MTDSEKVMIALQIITLAVLTVTCIIMMLSVRKQEMSNRFDAVTRIHERLASETSYKLRRYLHTHFEDLLCSVENKLHQSSDKTVEDFNQSLYTIQNVVDNYSALDAVEMILMDFDILAVPFWLKIKSARKCAKAYFPVLLHTARVLMPFIGIQQQLRRKQKPPERYYKSFYLCLLRELGILEDVTIKRYINTYNIEIPANPWDVIMENR